MIKLKQKSSVLIEYLVLIGPLHFSLRSKTCVAGLTEALKYNTIWDYYEVVTCVGIILEESCALLINSSVTGYIILFELRI